MRIKKLFWMFVQQFERNSHYIPLRLFGRTINACSRCLGMYTGMLVTVPIALLISFIGTYDFWHVFGLSWLLASFSIIDWGTAKLGIREGNNKIRIASGFLLGAGGMLYLFLLPMPLMYRIGSLWGYGILFTIVHYAIKCKKFNLSLRNPVAQNLTAMSIAPLAVVSGACDCGHTGGCCPCCG